MNSLCLTVSDLKLGIGQAFLGNFSVCFSAIMARFVEALSDRIYLLGR